MQFIPTHNAAQALCLRLASSALFPGLRPFRRARIPLPAAHAGNGDVGEHAFLREGVAVGKADAVLAASIFHYQTYSVPQAKAYLSKKGVPVRLV